MIKKIDRLINRILYAKTPYNVFDLHKGCTKEDIEKKYQSLTKKLHSNKFKHPQKKGCIRIVNKAYKILVNDENRINYDNGHVKIWEDYIKKNPDMNPFELYPIPQLNLVAFETFEDFISPKLIFSSIFSNITNEFNQCGGNKFYRKEAKSLGKGVNDVTTRMKVFFLLLVPFIISFFIMFILSN